VIASPIDYDHGCVPIGCRDHDVIWLHSPMITATMIAADCSQMINGHPNPNPIPSPGIVEGIPVILAKNIIHYSHEIIKLTFLFKICQCRRAKLWCDWEMASAHALTVSTLCWLAWS